MTITTEERAQFESVTAPLRAELVAHCYRMLGSLADAEDQVQETYLRAWRAFHDFEGRSSVRTWMYKIATNTCLNALSSAGRRVLPTGLGQGPADPRAPLEERREESWLEPLPEQVLWGAEQPSPEDAAVTRDGVRLAWVAALQELPPRQRAALVLREVLGFSAKETAEALGLSVASVNSSLQRARATVAEHTDADAGTPELSERDRRSYEAFLTAFDDYDIPTVIDILADDVAWQMPPFVRWYTGPDDVAGLITTHCPAKAAGDLRMLPATVNGAPGAGMYLRGEDGRHYPFQLMALEFDRGRITAVTGWFEPGFFAHAGLPAVIDGGTT